MRRRQQHILDSRPLPEKKKHKIAPKSQKRIEKEKEQKKTPDVSKLALEKWFADIRAKHWGKTGFCNCWECGEPISISFSRHASAHLLPKRFFKSVATHPVNYLILGAGCGCHSKSDRIDKFVQMKIWPLAASRMKIMIKDLPFDELKHISTELHEALDNTD